MHNQTLKKELKEILASKSSLTINSGEISGNSIEIFDKHTNTDFGSYVYYGNTKQRDEDLKELLSIINT